MDRVTNFGWIDALIILAYLVTLTGIGVYFSRRQKNLEDFFLAGRSMGWLPIGMSLMAALNSGIDYVAVPGTTIKFGLIFVLTVTSWLLLYPWVAGVVLPFYRRLQIYSAYEYIEQRFDISIRILAASIFLLWRLGWMATAIYVPCLVINAVTAGKVPLVPLIILLGTVVTLYTMLGGIQAVIWTDVIQFCIMLGGLAITIAVVLANVPGGASAIWSTAQEHGKTNFFLPPQNVVGADLVEQIRLFFTNPNTAIGIIIATVVGRMSVYTCDQVMVQRFQTTRSLKDSKRAFIINSVGDTIWTLGLTFVGLALFAYFQRHDLPAEVSANPDRIFPFFMSHVFPTGVIGLVIAAILAASLSSIDSAINSCTSVAMIDFYNRLILKRKLQSGALTAAQERSQIRISRFTTLGFGLAGVILATQVSRIGMVIEIGNSVIQTFTGPLLGIYLLGMFTERARSAGVLLGGIVGTSTSLYLAFATKIGFIWPTVFGLTTTLVVGYLFSLVMPGSPSKEAALLTWRNVMRTPITDR